MIADRYVIGCYNVSTLHVPGPNPEWRGAAQSVTDFLDNGWMVWVIPSDFIDDSVPVWLQVVMQSAEGLGCRLIWFEADAEVDESLPTYPEKWP